MVERYLKIPFNGCFYAYFSFSLPFFLIFMFIFTIFCGCQHIFMGGSDPPPFSDGGSEIFFHWAQKVKMEGQIVFFTT